MDFLEDLMQKRAPNSGKILSFLWGENSVVFYQAKQITTGSIKLFALHNYAGQGGFLK